MLPGRIIMGRNAILDRIEEGLKSLLASEHRAMNDALRNLRRLAKISSTRTDAWDRPGQG